MFINNLYAAITNFTLYNHGDDTIISASCNTDMQVIDTLKSESNIAIKWFNTNTMEVNPTKCKMISLNAPRNSI